MIGSLLLRRWPLLTPPTELGALLDPLFQPSPTLYIALAWDARLVTGVDQGLPINRTVNRAGVTDIPPVPIRNSAGDAMLETDPVSALHSDSNQRDVVLRLLTADQHLDRSRSDMCRSAWLSGASAMARDQGDRERCRCTGVRRLLTPASRLRMRWSAWVSATSRVSAWQPLPEMAV